MHVFTVRTRRWPDGALLGSTEMTTFPGPPGEEEKNAAEFIATGPSSVLQFLFWHTGRRLTGHRRVRWIFTTMGWSTWEATRWYGVPPTGPGGTPRVHAEPFSLISNSLMSAAGTPINGPASSFSPASAYPFGGNDKEIGTAGGPATVAARDPLSSLDFCGWQKLIWGGEPTEDAFIETDSGVSGNVPGDGSGGVFVFTPGATVTIPQNQSAELLAAYGSSGPGGGGLSIIDIIRVLERYPWPRKPWDIIADEAPFERIRRRLVEELLKQTQPVSGGGANDFNRIIETIPNMNVEDLKRTLQSVKTQVELGQTAVSSIEAQIKRLGKTK